MCALFNTKAYFNFLNGNFTLSVFYELLKEIVALETLFTSLCMVFGMHFDYVLVLLNSVAAAYVHLATSSVTIIIAYMCLLKSLKFIRD